jgi:hypothetical protein
MKIINSTKLKYSEYFDIFKKNYDEETNIVELALCEENKEILDYIKNKQPIFNIKLIDIPIENDIPIEIERIFYFDENKIYWVSHYYY